MSTNQILARMSGEVQARLAPHLKELSFALNDVIRSPGQEPKYLYFPHSGIVSVLILMENGDAGEVAVIGYEGVVGLSGLLRSRSSIPLQMLVQAPCSCAQLPLSVAQDELRRDGSFADLILHSGQSLVAQIAQTAVCNRFHSLEQQFARWLLMCWDRLNHTSNDVSMTQEMVANMLGVRREGVNIVARRFQQREIIKYSRGRITILNKTDLEARACECYAVVKKSYASLD